MKTLLIACGALAKETKELIDKYGWPVDLKALPALHHMTPLKITADLDAMLARLRAQYDRVIVVYGECGATGNGIASPVVSDTCRGVESWPARNQGQPSPTRSKAFILANARLRVPATRPPSPQTLVHPVTT